MPVPNAKRVHVQLKGYELMEPFLAKCGRAIDKVVGDGNCLFRALAKQLSGNPEKHMELRKLIINFEASNFNIFGKLCTAINGISLTKHIESKRKVFTWGTTLEILAAASLFSVDIFEVTESLVPGKVKWIQYSPINGCENFEDVANFGCKKSWLELAYIGSCHFDSIRPLSKTLKQTRPQIEATKYNVDLTLV